MITRITLETETKVFPLSETIFLGSPRLAMKRLRQRMKVGVVRFGTKSKWTALVTQHVNKQIQVFWLLCSDFVNSGPAKSTPTNEKGGAILTRKEGRGGGGGLGKGLPSCLLQITHLCRTCLVSNLPFGTQNLEHTSARDSFTPL